MEYFVQDTEKKTLACECGSKDFWVTESLLWKAFIDGDGIMQCHNKDCEIEKIICKDCGKEYTEEQFKEINFN